MKKYIFLTNIPAPYRVSMYNELERRGLNFEVYYMRATEADRNWPLDRAAMRHRFYIDRGLYAMLGHYHLHINPRLLVKLIRDRDAEVIIGGSWNDVDVLALVLLKRARLIRNQLHFWSEANYLTVGARNDNGLKRFVRRFVYNSSNGAQISSGKMTELTLAKWGIRGRTFIPLPNTIQEECFQISDDEAAARRTVSTPTLLMPVRLAERIKGIINFFRCIGPGNARRARFLIAGDGPDRDEIQRFIEAQHLEAHVEMLGFCDTERMAALYKRAHAVVLASFSDPSPLTLVEALRMRLPLLVSERCGNHYETVVPGQNGYVFDPSAPETVRRAFDAFMQRQSDWSAMGDASGDLYRTGFARERVIGRFMDALEAFSG